MIYKVERKNNKIYIIEPTDLNTVPDINLYFEVDCPDVNKAIQASLDTRTVVINTDTKSIEFEDEKFYNIPVTDKLRVNIIRKAKLKMESLVQSVDMITYINYIDINNELYNYGIFITDSNREEKYLEILETGDEHKIDLLEDLLLAKDKLGIVKSAKNNFDKVLEQVNNLSEDNTDELDKILNRI